MLCYLIDATTRTIQAVECDGLPDLQKAVGGYIEIAFQWKGGDVCFVDEEGLFKPQVGGFWLAGRTDQPFLGNGIVCGRETVDRRGEYISTEDPSFPIEELRAQVRFIDRKQIDAWGKGNASEPAVTFTVIEPGGKLGATEIIQRFGPLFADMPRPPGEEG